jgi:uncharacterized protein (DUF58 family)
MNRTYLSGFLALALIFFGLMVLNNGILAISLLLIVYLASGLIFSPPEIQIEINRRIDPHRATPDDRIEIVLRISNKGKHLEEVLIKDKVPAKVKIISGSSSLLTELSENETIEHSYTIQGERGIHYFPGIEISANDHFYLSRKITFINEQGSIFIMPQVPKIKRISIRPRRTHVFSGSIPARIGGPGVEFFGVREYQFGDTLQRINWRASARHPDTLFSNEFLQERVTDVGIILDARKATDIRIPQGSLFEHKIIATAALTDTFIAQGNRVGLLVYGQILDWTFPGYGKIQRERIFQKLARAQTGDSLVFEKLDSIPTRMFPAHSQLVLVSSLTMEDAPLLINMRAQGYQVLVISPDPIKFQQSSLPVNRETALGARLAQIERKLLFNKLRHAGLVVLNWDVSIPFNQAMQVALSRLALWSHHLRGRI